MVNPTGNRMTREIGRQSRLASMIAESQIRVSTGRSIQRPSDNPTAAARIATLGRVQSNHAAWSANLELARNLTAQADGVMAALTERLARASELAVAGASDTLSSDDRGTIASELYSIAAEIEGFAQTRSSLGKPLFAASGPVRYSESDAFEPLPSGAAIFAQGGAALADTVRNAGLAIALGNAPDLAAIDNAVAHAADMAADIGLRAARVDRLREMQQATGIDIAAERSALEDTDLSRAIAELNAQTITLEAAQAAFARINRRTLFDILG